MRITASCIIDLKGPLDISIPEIPFMGARFGLEGMIDVMLPKSVN